MKYFYIVFTENYLSDDGEKMLYIADVMRVSTADNIAARLEHIGGLLHANICETKKKAEAIRDAWNEQYKKNNVHFYYYKRTA